VHKNAENETVQQLHTVDMTDRSILLLFMLPLAALHNSRSCLCFQPRKMMNRNVNKGLLNWASISRVGGACPTDGFCIG
jgi:hypothetical protein